MVCFQEHCSHDTFPDRAQKSLGLVGGTPSYEPIESFQGPDVPARTYQYSSDGRLFAYTIPTGVFIYQAESAQLLQELALPNIVEIHFSPRGTYLSTWERPVKLEDGAQHKNLRVFSVSTGEELISFTQKSQEGWDLQYTISESHAVRLVSQEIQVFRPAEWSKGVVDKLKVEGATSVTLSPGLNPSVAVFVAEKKVCLAHDSFVSAEADLSAIGCSCKRQNLQSSVSKGFPFEPEGVLQGRSFYDKMEHYRNARPHLDTDRCRPSEQELLRGDRRAVPSQRIRYL